MARQHLVIDSILCGAMQGVIHDQLFVRRPEPPDAEHRGVEPAKGARLDRKGVASNDADNWQLLRPGDSDCDRRRPPNCAAIIRRASDEHMRAGRRVIPEEGEGPRLTGLGWLDEHDVALADLAAVGEELNLAYEAIGVDAFGDDFNGCL